MHASGEVKLETVGRPMPGVEVRIAGSGEVLVRSPGVMREYHSSPMRTREAIDAEGFFPYGGRRFFAHRRAISRFIRPRQRRGTPADGALFATKYLENKLKFLPLHQGSRVLRSTGAKDCAQFIKHRHGGYRQLGGAAQYRLLGLRRSRLPARGVCDLVPDASRKSIATSEADAALSGSQIRRFLILHKELDADDGELTRTRKVRRRHIAEKYAALVDALYSGRKAASSRRRCASRTGRTGTVSADLRILQRRPPPAPRRNARRPDPAPGLSVRNSCRR